MTGPHRRSPAAGHPFSDVANPFSGTTADPSTGAARQRTMEVTARAAVLRALHRPGEPVVLANAWDAGSARVIAAAGLPAVATSSGAVAESLGYADGEATPPGEMFGAIARIAAAVEVPVTADIERGYRLAPAELVERLVATGAAGCNLEDSQPRTGAMVNVDKQVEFLAAVRSAARGAKVDLVLNARVDSYLHGTGTPEARLADAIERSRRYLAAGADCVYPIFAADPVAIRELVEQVDGPVNILYRPGAPAVPELARLGVARISLGSGLYRAVRGRLERMAARLAEGADPYAES